MTDAPPVVYYPQYCFHLSPTLSRWCPLRAADVRRLTWRPDFEGQHVYFYRNHPIKWVRVAGVIVDCNIYANRRVLTLDDGSGVTVECKEAFVPGGPGTAPKDRTKTEPAAAAGEPEEEFGLGQVVGIKGKLQTYQDWRTQEDWMQVQIVEIVRLRSTEEEVHFWAKVQDFAASVLSQPWRLDRQVVRQCRREAEGARTTKEKRAEQDTKGREGRRGRGGRDASRDSRGSRDSRDEQNNRDSRDEQNNRDSGRDSGRDSEDGGKDQKRPKDQKEGKDKDRTDEPAGSRPQKWVIGSGVFQRPPSPRRPPPKKLYLGP